MTTLHTDRAKTTSVAGGAILENGLILCAQRGPGRTLEGCWEFPGGKIKPGESPSEALRREIFEELDCTVRVLEPVCTTMYTYPFGRIALCIQLCRLTQGRPQRSEHRALRWLAPADLPSLNWAPADRPAVAILTAVNQCFRDPRRDNQ
ncbi:(deoxy)nucleoside triphosphate pyrophosphohydrolase [Bifidobacterium asteroides]|uniref:(deoxy)nucleoside triphosphate pyrophosphohydrolase n=1 Tax=Bifidobacterium asteroides TaxID=1684 RepID=UPI0009D9FEDF|nr:(deoxy)nucleoside triphosphate pyrophosphohydrolase [Bifidobacterium asteroides]